MILILQYPADDWLIEIIATSKHPHKGEVEQALIDQNPVEVAPDDDEEEDDEDEEED
jgi:hypothetical protein